MKEKYLNVDDFYGEPLPVTEQTWGSDVIPLLSISCITYNQEKFIRDAIESFLMQKTTFPIEILIHDDASTDKTADIVREYEIKYPNLIKPIYQNENQYSKRNGIIGRIQRTRARGKYYAMCEGDDYWIDSLKLQKQVDFLEKNPDYVLTSHSRIIVDENRNQLTNTDSLTRDYGTQCIVFRNVLKDDFISFNAVGIANGDTFLLTYLENFGKITILDFVGSAYRKTGSGVWAKHSYREKYRLAEQSFNRMEYFFKKYNYKKSFQRAQIYRIWSIYRYAMSLKCDKFKREAYKAYFYFIAKLLSNLKNPYIYDLSYLKMILIFPIK